MPFNSELAAGTLSEARFKHYITQDAHYLIGFGRALALVAAKAPNPDRIVQFAKWAEVRDHRRAGAARFVFRANTRSRRRFSPTRRSRQRATTTSPSCSRPPMRSPTKSSWALLPCFWIYAEVGRDIHARAAAAHPYRAWIDTYAGEEFHAAVRAVIEATDEAADDASPHLRERMHAAFTRATQLEWLFWDSAYRLESWPV